MSSRMFFSQLMRPTYSTTALLLASCAALRGSALATTGGGSANGIESGGRSLRLSYAGGGLRYGDSAGRLSGVWINVSTSSSLRLAAWSCSVLSSAWLLGLQSQLARRFSSRAPGLNRPVSTPRLQISTLRKPLSWSMRRVDSLGQNTMSHWSCCARISFHMTFSMNGRPNSDAYVGRLVWYDDTHGTSGRIFLTTHIICTPSQIGSTKCTTSGRNCCRRRTKRRRKKLSFRPGYTSSGNPNVPTTGWPEYSVRPVSGPSTSASFPSACRCSSRRASVRVTPSIFGRKFSGRQRASKRTCHDRNAELPPLAVGRIRIRHRLEGDVLLRTHRGGTGQVSTSPNTENQGTIRQHRVPQPPCASERA